MMDDKICPFCSSSDIGRCKVEADPEDYDRVDCAGCGAYADEKHWNNRPQEQKLKDALQVIMTAQDYVLNEAFSRKTCVARVTEAIKVAKSILGIKK